MHRSKIREPYIELKPWRGASGGGAQAHRHILMPAPVRCVASLCLTTREFVIASSGYRPQHGVPT
jgi:hypothetical protein